MDGRVGKMIMYICNIGYSILLETPDSIYWTQVFKSLEVDIV